MLIEIYTTGDTHEITDVYANELDYIIAISNAGSDRKAILSLSPTDAVLFAKQLLEAVKEYNENLSDIVLELSNDLQKH